jgi:hypothetical protein
MKQSVFFMCFLLAICATGHGCTNGATRRSEHFEDTQSSERVALDIDQVLQKGMDQHAAFKAIRVTHRRDGDFGSILSKHYAVLCERFPGQEVQLDFGLVEDGWRLQRWVLFDHVRTTEVPDWVPASSDWAKEQDERIATILRQFADEDQENGGTQEPERR